ncbi:MAG TPA: helix-turn-helix domain-containing protein [Pseudolabrys sp.]|nr:helix-turn-helix domain-containing protein [Pseudolabrys sp.]
MPKRLNTDPERVAQAKLPASLFHTSALPAAERFSAWRESISVMMDVRLPQTAASHDFNARVESYLFDDIMLARCAAGAQKFDRSSIKFARDSIDHYMIQLFISGHVDMTHRRRDFRCKAGTVICFDLTDVMDTFNSDFDLLSVIVPRRRLAPLLTDPDTLQGVMVDPESGTGTLLTNYLLTLFSAAPRLTPEEASIAGRSLLDMLAMAFNRAAVAAGDVPEIAQHAEFMRVQSFIKEHLHEPGLDPETVAENVGMSRAQLYRLFAPVGGVAEYIREQRLRRCLADLLSVKQMHRQIAEIAYSWGFADPTYFAKAFKARFGRTPSEAREAASPQARPDRVGLDARVGDRLYEEWLSGLA